MIKLLIIALIIILIIKNDIIPVRMWIHKHFVTGTGLLVRSAVKLLSLFDSIR